MSAGKEYLHSHSALERELRLPKHVVLVDTKFENLFDSEFVEEFKVKQNGQMLTFLKVPILEFVKNNGVFKNLMT